MNLIVDLNNAVSVQRHGKFGRPKSKSQKEKLVTESLFLFTLRSIMTTMRVTQSNALVIVKDSKGLWRRSIYPTYKVTEDVDALEDHYRDDVIQATELLYKFFEECTGAYTLSYLKAEADDVIGTWCKYSNTPNTIMSSDKDFIQLVDERNRLYYPSGKTYRTTEDRKYDLFLKCVRGDKSDKIRSVWSGIRETRLIKAWNDPLEMVNLMESTTPSGEKFKDLYNLNKSVIDLDQIPRNLTENIIKTIEEYKPAVFREMGAIKWIYKTIDADLSKDITPNVAYLKRSPVFNA